MTMSSENVLPPQILKEINVFERFSHQLGFKRIDGSIYGLLVLTDRPLSSEDIESTLNLSQSAVCLGLKNLAQYGAIETNEDRTRRCKVHKAKEDSLSIAATVFRKREQQDILDFKEDIRRMVRLIDSEGDAPDSDRYKRLNSIISTCEIADSVTNFVIGLSQLGVHKNYSRIKKILPQVLEIKKAPLAATLADNLKDKINRFTQE
jgi:DNA-binding transcriptional regulator GbsR (MarR family)